MVVVNERVSKIDPLIVATYNEFGVGDIGHILEADAFMDVSIKPIFRDVKLVGSALTAKMTLFEPQLTILAVWPEILTFREKFLINFN